MRGPIDRRRVLGGIEAMITGSALAGSASGEEHGNDEENGEEDGSGDTLGTDGRRTTYEGTLTEDDQRNTYSFEAVAGEGIELEMAVLNLEPGRDATRG